MKNAYIKAALFIYRYAPFMRVSAVVIFLHLFMSGDVELHPGPQGELLHCQPLQILLVNFYVVLIVILFVDYYRSTDH